MMMKKTASAQVITASVSSQPLMSCHAGRVNRKKFSALPKIGSTTPPVVRAAYQKSASGGDAAADASAASQSTPALLHPVFASISVIRAPSDDIVQCLKKMTALRFRALGQLDIIRLWESCRPGSEEIAPGESEPNRLPCSQCGGRGYTRV